MSYENIKDLKNKLDSRISFFSAKEVIKNGTEQPIDSINELLDSVESAYLSIDMDVLDPSFAPGVSNPHPEGLSTTQVMDLVQGVMKRKFVGLDVNEVSPFYDQGVTAILAGYITMETLFTHISC